MNILIFMIALIGIRTLNFVLEQFVEQHFVCVKSKKRFQFLVLVLAIVTILTFSLGENHIWVILFLFLIVLNVVFHLMVVRREKRFKDGFCHKVDQIILEMRSGASFRTAFERITAKAEPFEREKLKKILEMIRFRSSKKEKNDFVQKIVTELFQIDQHSHNAIQRLNTLRLKLRTESEFRKKTHLAVLQIRAQGIILSGLYLVTLLFIMKVMPNSIRLNDFLISFSLFSVGTLVIFLYGRRYRWKL